MADHHAAPYRLRYVEIGNEERVDEAYAAKFGAVARAIWAANPDLILVVGDFAYSRPIADPFNFEGAVSGIKSLAAHQGILRLAREHGREVWFDVHVGTDGPRPDSTLAGMFSFRDALAKVADGARHRVVVFELNAGNHAQRRALANALAIHAVERDGRIPIVTSANGLQPDGQNDNGWDQGLLFLNPSRVWLQPPGYVTQMLSRNYLPQLVDCRVAPASAGLDFEPDPAPGADLVGAARHFREEAEEAAFAFAADGPVHRHALVTGLRTFAFHAVVEKAPRRVLAHGRDEVVPGLVEVEVIVLVEQDRLVMVTGHGAALAHHGGDAVGVGHAVAVQEQKVGGANDVGLGDRAPAVRGAGEQTAIGRARLLDARDQLVDAVKTIKTGDPLDPDTELGPMIDAKAANRVDLNGSTRRLSDSTRRSGVGKRSSTPASQSDKGVIRLFMFLPVLLEYCPVESGCYWLVRRVPRPKCAGCRPSHC